MKKALSLIGIVVAVVLASVNVVSADPIVGPISTPPGPPGGVTITTGGNGAANTLGRTFNFSALDPSAYGELYWGVGANAPTASLDGTPDSLTFFGISGNTVTFTGTTLWNDAVPPSFPNNVIVPIKLDITLNSGGSWVSAASLGLAPSLGYLVDISGTSFSTHIQFSANIGSGFQALNTVPQFPSPSPTTSSFTGGFYYTPAAVPDPASTLGLFSLALAGLATAKRRFSSR